MDDCTLFTCADFWKDVKKLSKNISPSFLECEVSTEEFDKLSVAERIYSIPLLRQVSNTIKNKINNPSEIPNNDRNGQQPFLTEDWIMWKMRWGVDKRGPSYGLRIMYCINSKHIVLAAIKHKKEIIESESEFQNEVINRLRMFFDYGYSKEEEGN